MNNNSIIKEELRSFFPGYFALVMSTGIISIALNLLHFEKISTVFFWLNNLFYAILLIIFFIRLVGFYPAFKHQLATHAKGAGFLTLVAGSCILGNEYAQQQKFVPA